jgi:acetate kinase
MADAILVINAGSSSLKCSLFGVAPGAGADSLRLSLKGQVEGIGTSPHFVARDRDGAVLVERCWPDDASSDHAAFFRVVSDWLRERGADRLSAVGHLVVHGGPDLAVPVLIDDAVLRQLDRLGALAPLHQPHNLAGIRAVAAVQPDLPQVACFDTAFHRGHPEVADWFALPRAA